jgi:hypothetical protein
MKQTVIFTVIAKRGVPPRMSIGSGEAVCREDIEYVEDT